MTTKELNRDIKRLYKNYMAKRQGEATDQYYKWVESEVKPELKRLYYADNTFNSLNADSLKMLLRLNLCLRVIPFHQFGLFIDL